MEKLTDKEHQLVMHMFIGKVAGIIGFDKCLELIRESKEDLALDHRKTFQERLEKKDLEYKNRKLQYRHKEKIAVIQSALDRGQSISSICKEYGYNRGLIYRLIDRNLIIKTK